LGGNSDGLAHRGLRGIAIGFRGHIADSTNRPAFDLGASLTERCVHDAKADNRRDFDASNGVPNTVGDPKRISVLHANSDTTRCDGDCK
jgi:hypothetical protein